MSQISNKTILIIGGTGSLGHVLVSRLYPPEHRNKLIIFSRDENKQWNMKITYPNVAYVIGDMRNRDSIKSCLTKYKPDIIIIAGALKHIDICEDNIGESISTNIIGIQNIVKETMNLTSLETVLFISTDKACSPINVYGQCKSIAEKIITSSNNSISTKFLCVRYGNVINSRGSLIPKFKHIGSLAEHSFFPITDDNMTRFFMTLEHSTNLIFDAIHDGKSGDIWIPKIHAFKVKDIAEYFSQKYNKPIKVVGVRPGEKMHECLINSYEYMRAQTINIKDREYYIIKPYGQNTTYSITEKEYTSKDTVDINLLTPMLDSII